MVKGMFHVILCFRNEALAERTFRMMKKKISRRESISRRRAKKYQRKEKRATKTLGIVVGMFAYFLTTKVTNYL